MVIITPILFFAVLCLAVVMLFFVWKFIFPNLFKWALSIFGERCIICKKRRRKIKTALIDGYEFNICHRCYKFVKIMVSENPEVFNYFNEHIQKTQLLEVQKTKGNDIKPKLNISKEFAPMKQLLDKHKTDNNFKKKRD